MSTAMLVALPERGVVKVDGADASKFLQGLITNDMERIGASGDAIHAGLLSPQGKILFEFFVVGTDQGYLLDVARDKAVDLAKRLAMYRLRADVAIAEVSDRYRIFAFFGDQRDAHSGRLATPRFVDPRLPELGQRLISDAAKSDDVETAISATIAPASAYQAHRISLGIPEGGVDYEFGDAFPHEANFDLFNGVSFSKGCYVGQEIVARMHNKSVVRKRVTPISGTTALTPGASVLIGDVAIGRVGSVDGRAALAMLRLDRAVEAQDRAIQLKSNDVAITADAAVLDRYRRSTSTQRASSDLPS
ncbi:MAG: YgfZ/GcvT domain-containing protein [Hyphomicrobium sp.]